MPDFRELLSLEYWREHTLVLAYAGTGLLLFLIFIIGTFPYDRALTSTLTPLGYKVSYSDERPAFPIGTVLENVRLISLQKPAAPPLVQSESLKLTPGLGTLIGHPGIGISADAYGGQAWAKVQRAGKLTTLTFSLSDIDLGRYPMASSSGIRVKGVVSGSGNLAVDNPSTYSQVGDFSVDGRNMDFIFGKLIPAIKFSRVKGSFSLNHRTLRVNALDATGPDLSLNGSGVIHMGPTLASSTMELTLHLRPTLAGRKKLGVLMGFLPHPPDNRPYLLHGPLLTPSVS